MSHFEHKSIPAVGDGATVTATNQDATAALAYLTSTGNTDVTEALGITGYMGHDYRATAAVPYRSRPAWRDGSVA